MKGNTVWAHFTATGYFPTNIHLSRLIPKEVLELKLTVVFISKWLLIGRTLKLQVYLVLE